MPCKMSCRTDREPTAKEMNLERNEMTRELMVRLFGAVVFAATVLVTVMALVHLF